MNLFEKFSLAMPLDAFLSKYGSADHKTKWQGALEQTLLTDSQKRLLGKFTRRTNVLVLAGAWCGDCSSQCPAFERFAEVAPVIVTRYLDRDEHAEVQEYLRINGGNRVPVAVFFSEDGHEIARYGERTLARYRQLAESLVGEVCGSGIVKGSDPVQMQVVQEWLDQFERVQWMLRLSPRLRKLHGD
jgi:thiol-disulfide isomerase/thioredoxin